MNSRKLEDLLKQVSPPDVSLPSSKAKLRRDLLNHPRYNPRPSWFRRMFPRMAMAGAPLLVLALVFFVLKFIPDEMSAHTRLQELETTYRGSLAADMVHYIKARFYGTHQKDSILLLLEQWRYKEEALRILLRREKTGEHISHLIVKGERIFLYNDQNSGARIKASRTGVKSSEPASKPGEKSQHAFSVAITPLKEKNGKKRVNVIISRDSLDIFGFASQLPGDIFSRLQADPGVTYAGSKTDDGIKLDIFERKSSPTIASYILEYRENLDQEVRRLLKELEERELKPGEEPDGFKVERIDVVEILRVKRHNGRIASLTRRSFREGKTIASHELNFLDEEFLPYDPAYFDEFAFGLHYHETKKNEVKK